MITRCETYVLREPAGSDLIETLGLEYSKSLPEKEEIIQYYDTFDWRLYQKGLALIQTGNAVYLQRISDGAYPHDQIEMKQHLEGPLLVDVPRGRIARHIAGGALCSDAVTPSTGEAEGLRIWRFKCR